MDNLKGRRWWLTLDIGILIHQKSKSKKDYQIFNKACLTLRATHLEEISRYMDAKGNKSKESRIPDFCPTSKTKFMWGQCIG